MQFLQYTPARYGILDISARLAQDVFGLPALAGLAGVLAMIGFSGLRLSGKAPIRRISSDDNFLLLCTGAGLAPFILVPEDPAYCIPGITAGLLLLARWSTRPMLMWVFAGLCFVTSAIGEIRVRRGWGVEVRQGAVYHEILAKRRQMDAARQLLHFQPPSPEKPAWIIAGYLRPVLGVLGTDMHTLDADAVAARNGVTYVYLMTKEELQNVVAAGFTVYMQPEAVAYTKHLYNFDPTHYGAQILNSAITE